MMNWIKRNWYEIGIVFVIAVMLVWWGHESCEWTAHAQQKPLPYCDQVDWSKEGECQTRVLPNVVITTGDPCGLPDKDGKFTGEQILCMTRISENTIGSYVEKNCFVVLAKEETIKVRDENTTVTLPHVDYVYKNGQRYAYVPKQIRRLHCTPEAKKR